MRILTPAGEGGWVEDTGIERAFGIDATPEIRLLKIRRRVRIGAEIYEDMQRRGVSFADAVDAYLENWRRRDPFRHQDP